MGAPAVGPLLSLLATQTYPDEALRALVAMDDPALEGELVAALTRQRTAKSSSGGEILIQKGGQGARSALEQALADPMPQ